MTSVELIAHRGAPREAVENTLPSFRRALDHRADGIELDVHFSSDGVPVVHHDPVLGPHAGRHAALVIADLTAATLASVSVGRDATLPSLRDVADLVGARATLYVEVKAHAGVAEIAAVHDALAPTSTGPAVRYALHSFDHRIARRSAELAPAVPVGILSESYLVDTASALRSARARDLWQHWSQIDASLVAEVHAAGGRVVVWTVNAPERARWLAALGVDALCTDDIPLVRAALAGDARVAPASTRAGSAT